MSSSNNLSSEQREAVVSGLSRLLADSYALYVKSHNFHWNVTGPMFPQLHALFEEHYTELAQAVDEVAERIRQLGARAPGSFAEFQRLTRVRDAEGAPSAKEMVRVAQGDHEAVAQSARAVLAAAQAASDDASVDLATERLRVHEKSAWMLRSILD